MQVIDPVCKMTIEDKDAVGNSTFKGTTYYFCTEQCKENFDRNPEAYLEDISPVPISKPILGLGTCTGYTCPMHPEVKQADFGSCPQCGMALEPVTPSLSVKTEWICPMHPEIIKDMPGSCPIC